MNRILYRIINEYKNEDYKYVKDIIGFNIIRTESIFHIEFKILGRILLIQIII